MKENEEKFKIRHLSPEELKKVAGGFDDTTDKGQLNWDLTGSQQEAVSSEGTDKVGRGGR